ncbi:DUF6701 domain-containing protein [Idiomarina sp. UBA3162]|uniref:DUF6701 domain-containing protein n=1 Tax=Idiomarina sp. UBA3162 TaxID=1946641 RepID=UPI000C8DD1E0|nr:DUF6701 domain-containing protein [Idiomarina sp. UBA3162]MAD52664.1 hypothetical protein [Idiomarinaceae bacterium]
MRGWLVWLTLLLAAALMSVSALAKQYQLPDDAGKNNNAFNPCRVQNESGVTVIRCPSSVFGQVYSRDRVAFNASPVRLELTGDVTVNAEVNVRSSAELLVVVSGRLTLNSNAGLVGNVETTGGVTLNSDLQGSIQTNGDVSVNSNGSVSGRVASGGSVTNNSRVGGEVVAAGAVTNNSNARINGPVTAGGSLTNNGLINGNTDVEGSLVNNSNAEINGNVNVDGALNNNGRINGQYINAPCTDSPNPRACGNGQFNVDRQCNINDNEGPCVPNSNNNYTPVGDWHFDEDRWSGNAGEVVNSVGNNYAGFAQQDAYTSAFNPARPGSEGTCRYGRFNGNNYVEIPNVTPLANQNSVSLSMWLNGSANAQNAQDNYQTLIVYGEGPTEGGAGRFEVYRRTRDGRLYFEVRSIFGQIYNVSVDGNQVFDGNWHHLAATFDNSNRRLSLYIDNSLVATQSLPASITLNYIGSSPELYIGGQQFQGFGFNGSLDEVTVASGVYSSQRVSELYTRTRPCTSNGALPQCSAVWADGFDYRGNNEVDTITLPDQDYGTNLPQQLDPIDYLRVGNFSDIGQNYQTNGPTSRVYIDGDLTIQAGRRINVGGDPNAFMLIVTGDLTIAQDVQINGYIYVAGDFTYYESSRESERVRVNGAISVAGSSYYYNDRYDIEVNYQAPAVPLAGGQFCAAQPAELPDAVLRWQMNSNDWQGNAGEVIDSSINNLNGVARNGAQRYSADSGSALVTNDNGFGTCGYGYFDNIQQQYLEVADAPMLDLSNAFTIGLWVKPQRYPASGLMTLVSKDENYEFHLRSDGTINWWWNTPTGEIQEFNSQSAVPLNQWSYVAIRYQNGAQTIFINGEVAGTASFTGGVANNNDPLQVGADQGALGRYFSGFLDELSVFDQALSERQIRDLQQQRTLCGGQEQVCVVPELNSSSFAQDWTATTFNNSTSPSIVNGRIRLTSNQNNQSTALSLNQSVPARGHLTEVVFRMYAYAGSGADGIALVFSDSNQVAQPGNYGGSLGYANGNNNDGFNGGWLGVGFDEYGNFSRATEGRVGGLGDGSLALSQTRDRVVLRGAETGNVNTQYQFIGASEQLVPGIDESNSIIPAPGHLYRVRIDNRDQQNVAVSVERDLTGTGNAYTTIYDNSDISAIQPQLPQRFTISFTGSTGGSTNIHEFNYFSVCSLPGSGVDEQVDHYRLAFSSPTVLCNGAQVQVSACQDSECSSLYNEPATVTLSDINGTWSNAIPTFTGSTVLGLQPDSAGSYRLGITDNSASPVAANPVQCFVNGEASDDCTLQVNDAGFVFVDDNASGINSIARQTSGTTTSGIKLRAVQTNDQTLACEAVLEPVSTIEMRAQCIDPQVCQDVSTYPQAQFNINNTAIPTRDDWGLVPVDFVDGEAAVELNYGDAGATSVSARAQLDNGVVLQGTSNPFVWTPASIDASHAQLDSNSYTGGIIAKAGEPFKMELQARNSNGDITPNFGNEIQAAGLVLDSNATASGLVTNKNGELSDYTAFTMSAPATFSNDTLTYSEVGFATVTAEIAGQSYLAQYHQPNSGNVVKLHDIGRFIPAAFELIKGNGFTNVCSSAEPFLYIGEAQQLDPNLRLEAVNTLGEVTENYQDAYAKAVFETGAFDKDTDPDHTIQFDRLNKNELVINWDKGIGTLVDPSIVYQRQIEEGPYEEYTLGLRVNDKEDGNYYSLLAETTDLISPDDDDGPNYASYDTARLLFARFNLMNSIAPQNEDLLIDGGIEYWDGFGYQLHTSNSCYDVVGTDINATEIIEGGDSLADLELAASPSQQRLFEGRLARDETGINDRLRWLARPNPLQFTFELNVPSFLKYDWDGDNDYDDNPTALGVFGIYRGSDRQIYWQEVGW